MTNAVKMNKKLEGNPYFKARLGWLDKFHHSAQQLDVSGEKLVANSAVADFKQQLNLYSYIKVYINDFVKLNTVCIYYSILKDFILFHLKLIVKNMLLYICIKRYLS